jgi:multidrug efflux pump subunit AcrA (membrane-fusion protein)
MFARVGVVLERAESVVIVPEQALTKREGQEGLFLVDERGSQVSWRPVQIGIRQSRQVGIEGEGLQGRVVVLGQQLLDDGSAVAIADDTKQAP